MATDTSDTASPEPSPNRPTNAWSTRRKAIATAIVAVVIAAVIVTAVAVAVSNSNSTRAGGASPGTTPGNSATPKPTGTNPASSASPSPSAGASDDPSVPASPVPIDQPAPISPGLTAEITKFEAVQGKARTPGEVSGPSIRLTVTITNGTSGRVSLATTIVTAYYGDAQTPALELSEPGGSPLPADVAAGQSATGTYIFTVPVDQRGKVRVVVDYSVDVQPLVFEGAVP